MPPNSKEKGKNAIRDTVTRYTPKTPKTSNKPTSNGSGSNSGKGGK